MSIPNSPLPGVVADLRLVSFADALDAMATDGRTSPEDIRRFRLAVAALSRVTDRRPASELPLSPIKLRPLLEAVLPARFRMSRKRWANIRSDLAAIGTLAGH